MPADTANLTHFFVNVENKQRQHILRLDHDVWSAHPAAMIIRILKQSIFSRWHSLMMATYTAANNHKLR